MNSGEETSLTGMPAEVLLHITDFLSTADLGSVRLTCKTIEAILFKSFAHEFFRKRQFMLSEQSLGALLAIADHPALSSCLEHVIIGTDCYDTRRGHQGLDLLPTTPAQDMAMHLGVADQFVTLTAGHGRAILGKCFAKLPNLKTVDIRDFNSVTRFRDGNGATWNSYLSPTASEMAGPRRLVMQKENYISELFSLVVAALADARAKVPNLEVVARHLDWGISDSAFYIPESLKSTFKPVLENLQKLHLCVDLGGCFPPTALKDRGRAGPNVSFFLQQFLSTTPNVTWLRFNFQNSWFLATEQFLSWLGSSSVNVVQPHGPATTVPPTSFPALSQLDLGHVTISYPVLRSLLDKILPTLRSLCFVHVSLMDYKHGPQKKVNLWATLFRWLRGEQQEMGQKLRKLSVRRLKLAFPVSVIVLDVFFDEVPNPTWSQYSGLDMAGYLEFLADKLRIHWPPTDDDEDDNSDDNSSGLLYIDGEDESDVDDESEEEQDVE